MTISDKPSISIIVPSFNRENLIGETLDSIIAQTYQNWECIVVDDGSTDRSLDVILQYAERDDRVKLHRRNRMPKGAPVCRNIGIEMANGNAIIFLDSDDVLSATCLETRFRKMENNPANDFLVFQSQRFYSQPGDCDLIWNISTDEEDLLRFIKEDIVWCISGPIWKKDFLVSLQGFTETFPNNQDVELHIRALLKRPSYKKYLNDQPDVFIRSHNNDAIGQNGFSQDKRTYEAFYLLLKVLLTKLKSQKKYKRQLSNMAIKWYSYALKRGYISLSNNFISIGNQENIFTNIDLLKLNIIRFMNSVNYRIESKLFKRWGDKTFKHRLKQ